MNQAVGTNLSMWFGKLVVELVRVSHLPLVKQRSQAPTPGGPAGLRLPPDARPWPAAGGWHSTATLGPPWGRLLEEFSAFAHGVRPPSRTAR